MTPPITITLARSAAISVALLLAACKTGGMYVDPDARADDDDASVIDAGIDAGDIDIDASNFDANPAGPIVSDGQSAELVLGQPNFNTEGDNTGGLSASSLKSISGLASDGAALWAADTGNCRALRWTPTPTTSAQAAGLGLGTTSLTVNDCSGASASDFGLQGEGPHVAISGSKLIITDTFYNRVDIWNPLPTTNGQAANIVLGQTSFGPITGGNTSSKLSRPRGIWTDGTRLVIADANNYRVLIWTTFPTTNAEPADIVLGQTDFGLATVPATPTASNMHGPTAVYFDGTRFYVSDHGHHRIMVWNSFPTTNNQAADFAIGQPNLTTATPGTTATTLNAPQSVAVAGGSLFVADELNDRVLVYTPIPTASGAAAAHVLGQSTFTAGGGTPVANQESLDNPLDLVIVADKLYVADSLHQRIMRFGLTLP